MPKLIFKADDMRRIVQHSLAAPAQRPMAYTTKPVSAPSIILVHDHGVYIMSNGTPRDLTEGDRSFVAYAKGCDPRTDANHWDKSRELVGGDDFAETLPWAAEIDEALKDATITQVIITLNKSSVRLGFN